MDFWVDKDTLVIRASGPAGYDCCFEGKDNSVKVTTNVNQLKAKAVKNSNETIVIVENEDLSALYADLRTKRNDILRECDWTQFNDSPLDVDTKESWAMYRKALRDLPKTAMDPTDISWPAPPS